MQQKPQQEKKEKPGSMTEKGKIGNVEKTDMGELKDKCRKSEHEKNVEVLKNLNPNLLFWTQSLFFFLF